MNPAATDTAIAILAACVVALIIVVTMLARRWNATAAFFSNHRAIGVEWRRFMDERLFGYRGR